MLTLNTVTEAEQEAIGVLIARVLPATEYVIFLQGDLGAGKTTLARGILRGLGYVGTVKSPTYTIIEPYQVAGRTILHLDLYRLVDPGELEYLGLEDLATTGTIWLIEWPERGGYWLPKVDLRINIQHISRGRRLDLIGLTENFYGG